MKRSEEHNRKIGEALRGRTFSKEWRRKISEALQGRPLSDEHKKAMSNGHQRRLTSSEARSKNGRNYRGGSVVIQYEKVLLPAGYVREYQLQWGRNRGQHYNLDFAHVGAKVNIEIDGLYHEGFSDDERDRYLRSLGWKVIRIKEV